jgi:hypothetical protein
MDLVISILIVIAVQFGMFILLRSRIERELNATTLLKDVQDEVDGMVRELNLSAERNIALLETRIEELEGLLAQSDQKMILMARELDRRERSADVYTQLKKPVVEPEALPEETTPAPVLVAEIEVPAPAAVPEKPAPAAQLEFDAEPEPPEIPAPRTLTERVLGFRDQGLDPGAIAGATGATRGEVELILSLHPLTSTR